MLFFLSSVLLFEAKVTVSYPSTVDARKTAGITYLADTVVVKDTQSLTKVRGVVPVMSSHCAGDVPPAMVTVQQVRCCPSHATSRKQSNNPLKKLIQTEALT